MYFRILLNNKLLSKKSEICKTYLSKFKGLMFRFLKDDESLFFVFNKEKILSLHMLFVFYPIQISWLNSKLEVVDVKKAYPFTPYISSKKQAKYILEMRKFKDVKKGDKLKLEPYS